MSETITNFIIKIWKIVIGDFRTRISGQHLSNNKLFLQPPCLFDVLDDHESIENFKKKKDTKTLIVLM